MVGTTRIQSLKHGEEPEIQEWPNEATLAALHQVSIKYGAWCTEMDQNLMMGKMLFISLYKMRITYQAEWESDVYRLKHVGYDPNILPPQPPKATFDTLVTVVQDDLGYGSLAHRLRSVMPGLGQKVAYPCACPGRRDETVWQVVQHLNDQHHPEVDVHADEWTRERIADWTEELSIDLTVDYARAERLKAKTAERLERAQRTADAMAKNGPAILAKMQEMSASALITKEAMLDAMVALTEENEDEHKH